MESHRLGLLGAPAGRPAERPVRHPWDTRGLKEGNLAVWGMSCCSAWWTCYPRVLVLLVLGVAM